MCDECQNLASACPPGGFSGPEQCGPGTDQIVDDKGCGVLRIANEETAGDNAGAAVLVHEALADWMAERFLKRFAKQFSTFRASRVRRNDTQAARSNRFNVFNENRRCRQRDGAAAE